MQPSGLSAQERERIGKAFSFERMQLPEPQPAPTKRVREVHPSLKRIDAWISATGAAATLCDLNGDGLSNELIHIDPRTDKVLVMPVPGSGERFEPFELTPKQLPYNAKTMAPMGTLVGDVNEDGAPDVIVYYWGRTPIAFLGSRPGGPPTKLDELELVSGAAQIWNTSCGALADFDGDGHLDLLFCNYFPDGAEVLNAAGQGVVRLQDSISNSFNGGKKHLLKWAGTTAGGGANFVEQENIFSDEVNGGWTIAVGATDLDGDLLPEIYFANDTGPDRLLHNNSKNGKIDFNIVTGKSGFALPTSFVLGKDSFKGMGCDFGDLNRDGVPDIYVSNIACPFGLQESHYVWLSNGKNAAGGTSLASYKQASENLGVSRSGWGWDCRLADFNNDGVMECLQATGFIKGNINRWPELQALGTSNNIVLSDPRNWPRFTVGDDVSGDEKNAFFVRSEGGKYFDCAQDLKLADDVPGRAIAVGDVDADGKLDFVVANQWASSFFFQNTSPNVGSSLSIKLLLPLNDAEEKELLIRDGAAASSHPAAPAIGAHALLHLPDGTTQVATIDGGSGHAGKRAQEIHFGLGNVPPESKLRVDLMWRTRTGVPTRRTVELTPGWHTIELFSGGAAKHDA
jgi:enediyne biosynthesis protein E4